MWNAMPLSQNLLFDGPIVSPRTHGDPPGHSLLLALAVALRAEGWNTSAPDDWRDSGWFIACRRDDATLEIALAGLASNQWMLQIAPLKAPGVITRLFGAKPSATANDIFALAQQVHTSLASQQPVTRFRWHWDGPPTETSDAEPSAPPKS